jgi:hypothetical protein
MALRSHPGVMGYSIGNEFLVDWPINGTHRSSFEGQAAGFILRRLKEGRAAAPRQLVTIDEGAALAKQWFTPELAFLVLSDVDTGNGRQPIRLAYSVDYLGTHYYPEILRPEDLTDGFASKTADATQKLAIYIKAAKPFGKPVVLNEFGLGISPETLDPERYSSARDRFFQAIIAEGQKLGIQGLLAWEALPKIVLIPGQYVVRERKLNKYSPVEVDIDEPNHTQRRVLMYHPEWSLFEWRNGSAVRESDCFSLGRYSATEPCFAAGSQPLSSDNAVAATNTKTYDERSVSVRPMEAMPRFSIAEAKANLQPQSTSKPRTPSGTGLMVMSDLAIDRVVLLF